MSSPAKILILLVALQLLLAATLPQISYSLKLAERPLLTEVVQHGGSSSVKEALAQPAERETEPLQDGVPLSAETLEDVKDSSIGLTDFSQDDPLVDTVPLTEEPAKSSHKLDANSPTLSIIDTGNMENDDSNIIEGAKAELPDVETLLEPAETLNEELEDSVNKIPGDIALIEEDTLQSTVDTAKPDSMLESIGDDTGYLQDAVGHSIGKLEINDLNIVKELAPTVASSVREVEESAVALAELDRQELSDGILQGTVDTVQETTRQTELAVVSDILKKLESSTTVEEIEILDDLGAGKIQDNILQSFDGDYADETGASISAQDLASSLMSAGSRVEQVALNQEQYDDVKIISNPKLTQEEELHIIEEALNAEGLRDWSEVGWKVVGMDFIGVTEPQPKWETALVYLHLPDGSGNPPVRCEQGWQAVINIRLDAGVVSDAGLPTLSSHECSSAIVLEEPLQEREGGGAMSVSAGVRPSFVIAETDDVTSSHIHGSAAFLNTPSFNSTIFENMDSYVAFLLNQKWSTSPTQHMTQVGWLISSIEGCLDCGSQQIPADSATLAFTDSSVFGNLEAHRIPLFEWEEDEDLVAGTWCNEESRYTIWAQYAGKIFNHNTNVSCENPDNNSKVSNSMFLENWNTAESPLWTDHIGSIEAHSAVTFRADETKNNFSLHSWERSTNEEQHCTGVRQLTATVQGDLTSGKTAKWTELGGLSPAC